MQVCTLLSQNMWSKNKGGTRHSSLEECYFWALTQSFTFSVLGYKLFYKHRWPQQLCVNYSGATCKLFCYNMQVRCKLFLHNKSIWLVIFRCSSNEIRTKWCNVPYDTRWKISYQALQYFQNSIVMCRLLLLLLIHVVFYCSLRLTPRCLASTLVIVYGTINNKRRCTEQFTHATRDELQRKWQYSHGADLLTLSECHINKYLTGSKDKPSDRPSTSVKRYKPAWCVFLGTHYSLPVCIVISFW